MAKPTPTVTDTLGVEIRVGDLVTVTSWGWNVRLIDTGRTFRVAGITWAGNLTHDTEVADGYTVRPSCVAVARRDGEPGHEGNRDDVELFRFVDHNGDEVHFKGTESDARGRFSRLEDEGRVAYLLDAEGNFMGGDLDAHRRS